MGEMSGISEQVTALLESSGHASVAASLRTELNALLSTDPMRSAEAAAKVQQMCHVRWLGDLYIPGISQQEWWNLLSKLKRYARRRSKPKSN